jgi:phospholipid/cholesterol/gamma-HCH transport system substrate-binding protein
MSTETPDRRPIIVGLFIFLGIVLLISAILIIGNLRETFKRKIKVVALFEDVSGLQEGNNVWFSGVKIGTVSDLQFYSKSQVKAVFKIEVKAQPYIRKDAKVKISTDGLIGNKILVIYGGTSLPEIQEGDTLTVEKTFSSDDMILTLQQNNTNLLAITNDIKTISKKLSTGEGTIGKLLNNDSVFTNINSATISLQRASAKAQDLISSLNTFSAGLNRKGTLSNELVTDTVVFNSLRKSVLQLQVISDSAAALVSNLKGGVSDPKSSVGMLLHDPESGARLKETIKNLDSSSQKLNEDLEAAQHNFLLRGYFRKKEKKESKQ